MTRTADTGSAADAERPAATGGSLARIAEIYTYPVKGLAGIGLESAPIGPTGLPGDRRRALPSSDAARDGGRTWLPRRSFRHLARDAELIGVPSTGPGAPDPAELVDRGVPLWDSPDTTVSLINHATLGDLAAVAGTVVDPRRFRANLYLTGLPAWAELGLVGHRLQVGTVELEVMRPIDRCRATTVNPDSGERDLNVPALLAGHFGHLYCGLYARVIRPGEVRRDSKVVDLGQPGPGGDAPSDPAWPRSVRVVERTQEAPDTVSVWLRDPTGLAHRARPGQHIRLLTRSGSDPMWRCYTVSGIRSDAFRITARIRGPVSASLAAVSVGASGLSITGPHGDVVLPPGDGPVLLLSAGIGITPTVAMLRALADDQVPRPVRVLQVDRGPAVPLWAEVGALADRMPDARVRVMTTRGAGGRRPGAADIADLVADLAAVTAVADLPDVSDVADIRDVTHVARGTDIAGVPAGAGVAFLCGPAGFVDDMREHLTSMGFPAECLRHERFYSPVPPTADLRRSAPLPGPFAVDFDGTTATWSASDGTLLELAEGLGLDPPSGCRSGACGQCAQHLRSGAVAYLSDPVLPPPDGAILLCCSVPTGDLKITRGR